MADRQKELRMLCAYIITAGTPLGKKCYSPISVKPRGKIWVDEA
jgi:hypothetical protein